MKFCLSKIYAILFFAILFIASSQLIYADGAEYRQINLDKFGDTYFSPIEYAEKKFNSVIIQSDRDIEGLSVNFNPSEGGSWQPVVINDEGYGSEALLFTSPTDSIQFKKTGSENEGRIILKTEFLYAGSDNNDFKKLLSGPEVAYSGLNIISRKQWGADESLRYWTPELEELFVASDKEEDIDVCAGVETKYKDEVGVSRTVKYGPSGEHLIWPLAYSKQVKKIVIHHTDSDLRDLTGDDVMDGLDYMAIVRAIYHFHAVTRGWGDIGYNYIIDPIGNVYEGRFGGDMVIGAHTRCYNNGAMGVAVIGNYDENDVPEPALNSLISLVAQKAKSYSIDPRGNSVFRGKDLLNIIGHKDVGPTACPGKKLYSLLPKIRERADLAVRSGVFSESALISQTLEYDAESLGSISTFTMLPNERKKITIRFKNTGTQSWDSNTWLHVALNNKPNARIVPIIEDKSFVAADMKENKVDPGQTANFEAEIESGYFAGNFDFEVAPVVNGRYKISKAGVFIPIQIEQPRYDYKVISQDLPSGIVFQGQKIKASMKVQNTGNVKWVNYGSHMIRMGTENLRDRRSLLVKVHTTRIAGLLESEVPPGGTGTFVFNLEAPERFEGKLIEKFSPVLENLIWLENKGLGFEINVRRPKHAARIVKKSTVTSMIPGEMRKIELTMENLGDLPWDQDNMKVTLLSKGIITYKKSLVSDDIVKPKQQVDFSFWIQAPYKDGRYKVFLRPRFNLNAIQGGTAQFMIDVQMPKLRAQLIDQKLKDITLKTGQEKEIEVKFKNIGNVIWRNKGQNAIYLAPSKPQDRLSQLYYEESWKNKFRAGGLAEDEVMPGGTGTFRFKIKPTSKGIYKEYFQLVIENVGWIEGSFVRWDIDVSGTTVKNSVSTKITPSNNEAKAPTVVSNTSTQNSNTEKPFRVRISYGDDSSVISSDKNYKIFGKNNEILFSSGANISAQIKRTDNGIYAQIGNISKSSDYIRIAPETGGIIEIKSMERRPAWNNSLNDNRFRGVIEVRPVNNETAFINELPLEDYLRGLAEVSNDTPAEKQKAIAVLARSYARYYLQDSKRKFPGMPYDGSDDPAIFQRYLGYGVEIRTPNFLDAVNATRNEVVTYKGVMVKTPYFTSSDGRTRSAQEVWGWTDTPFLQSVDDPYCKDLKLSGHGVGMSGCGSDGMAKNGKSYKEIIKYYFQGVEIEKITNFKF